MWISNESSDLKENSRENSHIQKQIGSVNNYCLVQLLLLGCTVWLKKCIFLRYSELLEGVLNLIICLCTKDTGSYFFFKNEKKINKMYCKYLQMTGELG